MTRKDYTAIANAIDIVRAGTAHHPALTNMQRAAGVATLERVADQIADACVSENAGFDRGHFMRAAGF